MIKYQKGKKDKKERIDSKKISLELFQNGKSIREIAIQREMAVTTIEGHLAHYVGEGLLEIERFVSDEKLIPIEEYFTREQNTLLTPAKEALGDEFSYQEIRFVLKHLQSKGKLK